MYLRKEDSVKHSEKQFNNLTDLINRKLDISLYERKSIDLQEVINDKITKIRNAERDTNMKLQNLDRDYRITNQEVQRHKEQLELKASVEETANIWKNFNNFAQYQELKQLYSKVNPEMQKFEVNMIEHRDDIIRFKEIIERFDVTICEKSSKQDLIGLEKTIREQYLSVKYLEEVKAITTKQMNKITEKQERIESSISILSA